ncbi:MAG: PEP-CTERM sorting domain-containing protein [Fimbriimonadaceae bacterium]|nr:PEP-CTERM sorting domain-containing protein [Fimbriimonadaceae bacterium]
MIGINGSVVVNFQSFWNKVQIVATDDSGNNVYFDEVGFTGLHRSDPWLAEVTYDAGTGDWDVSLDGNSVISANFGLDEAVTLTGNSAYVGLGAATGLGFDNNDALSWELQAVPEPATFLALGLGLLALRRKR